MLILSIKTDNPEAEIGLFNTKQRLGYQAWTAHRELSVTIHTKINDLFKHSNKVLSDLEGIVIFKGPGSFTGLRIGFSVANALADSLNILIVATSGTDWLKRGQAELTGGQNDRIALPEYGASVHITEPKH
jgi:tRNA threonylcarbamoyladenosine biosynthesis protein TsaB